MCHPNFRQLQIFFGFFRSGIPLENKLELLRNRCGDFFVTRLRILLHNQRERTWRSFGIPPVLRIGKLLRINEPFSDLRGNDLLPCDPSRIVEHDQQMTTVQRCCVIITYPGVIWKDERIGHAIKSILPCLLEIATTEPKDMGDSLFKNARTDKPASRRRKCWRIIRAIKERLMIDIIAILCELLLLIQLGYTSSAEDFLNCLK